ncbi:MAG: hypothetical protein P9L93_00095 [Candidatus Gorgyraea atricola]|nr:hypothetical protein [Candidatus Gorgyraea atricola]
MKKRRLILILCLILAVLIPYKYGQAGEDSDEAVSTVTLIIKPACHLTITDENVSETLVKDSSAEGAFSAGYVEFLPDKPTLQISSNQDWKLSVRSSGFNGPYSKSTADLMLKNDNVGHASNGFSDYKALSASDQEIASHNKGVKNESHPCQYKVLLDYENDIPGEYTATVTYTLSTSGA